MTDDRSAQIRIVARILREARGCEAPSLMEGDVVPCPFCRWGPDDNGKPHDETGCYWWAERILDAAWSHPTTPAEGSKEEQG
jgi:hypothetical protein